MAEGSRGEPRVQEKSWLERQREKTRLAAVAGALAVGTVGDEPIPVHHRKIEVIVEEPELNPVFDRPEFFERGRGRLTKEEQPDRIKELPNGEVVFKDTGLTFYKVEPGDTISEIRERLSRYPEYSHLKSQKVKLESFNIPPLELKAGMWLPIPMENADRLLTDEEFERYAKLAVKDMSENEGPYHKSVEKILRKISPDELVASLEAVAKQESGGKPIGQFEFHRYEPSHDTFSYSLFHVLMEGPGLEARRNLDLTEGQTYHPQNAVELMVGFLVEKGEEIDVNPASLFPLDKGNHAEKFARFYNGAGWKRTNPDYTKDLLGYYKEALENL
ncbi:MAG: hypothetical protein WC813_03260 [Patescibacteria group bacterium]|jgi:hypothetical protein